MKDNEKKYKGVYKDNKTGKFYVSTTFTTLDGFEIKKCKRGFKTQREANNWKEEQKIYYSKNNYSSSGAIKTPTELLLDKYYSYKKTFLKPTSYANMFSLLNSHFRGFFKDKIISNLTPFDIQEYYLYIANLKCKNQSKNVIIIHTQNFIEWLDLMELIPSNIRRKFKLICTKFEIKEESKNSYLEKDEIKRLLDTYGTSRDEKMLKLIVYTVLTSGVRHSELRALQYKDFDFVHHTLSVTKQLQTVNQKDILLPYTKTNKNKLIDIPLSLIEMVLELQEIDNASLDDYIFTFDGEVISPAASLFRFKKHLKAAKIHPCTIHDLRHTYATMLFDLKTDSGDNMFDEKYIAKQLGHSTPETSHRVYEHLTKDKRNRNKNSIELLSDSLSDSIS